MNVLVLNSGSSSVKYQLINMKTEEVLKKGDTQFVKDFTLAVEDVFKQIGALTVDAIGHRVVHGGEEFKTATLVTDETLAKVQAISHLAPLHNPANLMGIHACRKLFPHLSNVMVFDTAFHTTMPPEAFLYAIPLDDYKKHGLRRYGFHGTSHNFVTKAAAKMMGRPRESLRLISIHLGNGCSICAVDHGKSIDTSMGLTPLEGLVMGSRSGDIDPAVVGYLAKAHNFTVDETINYLNKQCGMKGLANINSGDMFDLMTEFAAGNNDVETAIAAYTRRLVKYLGGYIAIMGGVDAIIWTGGIGNNTPIFRERTMAQFDFLGASIDLNQNVLYHNNGKTGEISAKSSKIRTFVIKTNEEYEIANEVANLLKDKKHGR
jgi:acetate kinase